MFCNELSLKKTQLIAEHKLNLLVIRQRSPSEAKLSLISDLLGNDELSSRKTEQLSSMLLCSYIIHTLILNRPHSGLLNMQYLLFQPCGRYVIRLMQL